MNKCTPGIPRLREYTQLIQEADTEFVHVGDIHWSMCSDANKPWGKERVPAIKDISKIIIGNAKEMDVDYLFTSDDLFHR